MCAYFLMGQLEGTLGRPALSEAKEYFLACLVGPKSSSYEPYESSSSLLDSQHLCVDIQGWCTQPRRPSPVLSRTLYIRYNRRLTSSSLPNVDLQLDASLIKSKSSGYYATGWSAVYIDWYPFYRLRCLVSSRHT